MSSISSTPISLATEADSLALALESGIISLSLVRSWADVHIAERDQPEYGLLDLCGQHNLAAAISQLHEMAEDCNKIISAKLVFGYLKTALTNKTTHYDTAMRLLERLCQLDYVQDSDIENQINRFDDTFMLVATGVFQPEEGDNTRLEIDCLLADWAVGNPHLPQNRSL